MQNMKNAVLVLTAFLLLFPYKLMAENKVISIEDGWNIEDERSISFAPQLSIDEQNIYIYSEKELNDLEVIIKDSLGNVIYYNELPFPDIPLIPFLLIIGIKESILYK